MLDPAVVKANQQAFMKWLQDQELDIVDAYSIYNTAGKIHKTLLSDGMKLGLFGNKGSSGSALAWIRQNKRKRLSGATKPKIVFGQKHLIIICALRRQWISLAVYCRSKVPRPPLRPRRLPEMQRTQNPSARRR